MPVQTCGRIRVLRRGAFHRRKSALGTETQGTRLEQKKKKKKEKKKQKTIEKAIYKEGGRGISTLTALNEAAS